MAEKIDNANSELFLSRAVDMIAQQSELARTPPLVLHFSAIICKASSASFALETRLSNSSSNCSKTELAFASLSLPLKEAFILTYLEFSEGEEHRLSKKEAL